MKYLYIKILILLAILIPPTLMVESEAAGSSPINVESGESGGGVYFPITGNYCYAYNDATYGQMSVEKLVLPKNLTLSSYRKLKGTYHGYRIHSNYNKYSPKKMYNWKLSNAQRTYDGNDKSEGQGTYISMSVFNECNNNKMAVLLKRYRAQKRNIS